MQKIVGAKNLSRPQGKIIEVKSFILIFSAIISDY